MHNTFTFRLLTFQPRLFTAPYFSVTIVETERFLLRARMLVSNVPRNKPSSLVFLVRFSEAKMAAHNCGEALNPDDRTKKWGIVNSLFSTIPEG